MRRLRLFTAVALLLAPSVVAAHVRITSPTPRSTTVLKQRHCGATGSPRANVQTLPPGSPMHLVWDEYIPHPGWFRVSFQENGDIFEIPPEGGAVGSGLYPTEDLTGTVDPISGSLIIADRIVHGTLDLTFNLPNVECANCTVQLIQMMTDKPPYTIDTASNDIYFACVDLVLSATAPDAAPVPPADADPGNPGNPDGGAGGGGTTGGCSATAGGSSGILTLLAMVGLLRRRRMRA